MTPDIDLERLAQLKADFLHTELGEWLIPHLAELYNGIHHEAEAAVTAETKAFKVERAAGLRQVIDILTTDAAMYEKHLLPGQQEDEDEPE